MKVLGISTSPRKKSNSCILLKEALKQAKTKGYDTEIIFANNLNILPWQDKEKRCLGKSPKKDDMDWLIKKIISCDIIVLSSPIYFGSLNAQAKIIIDRCQILWEQKEILKKKIRKNFCKAYLILTEASDRLDFFKNAEALSRNFFAVIEAKYQKGLFCSNLENPGEALKHPKYLKKARLLIK